MQHILGVVFSISLSLLGTSLACASGDPARGAALFKKKCASCHALSEEARALSGPHLAAIVDARAGQVEGFKYSKALQQAAAAGLIWSPAPLERQPHRLGAAPPAATRGTADAADHVRSPRTW